jgi:hypothetical protein
MKIDGIVKIDTLKKTTALYKEICMLSDLEVRKVGSAYFAKLRDALCIRVGYDGKHEFVSDFPEGPVVSLSAISGDPPTPVVEKIKLAWEVTRKTAQVPIPVVQPAQNDVTFMGTIRNLFKKRH